MTPGARAARRIDDRVSLFLGGGLGPALIEGFGGSDLVAGWKAETGVRIDVAPGFAAQVGYQARGVLGADLGGHAGSPVWHGPVAGFRAEIPSFLGFLTYKSAPPPEAPPAEGPGALRASR